MLIVLLAAWIVVIPALVVGFTTYAAARRERPLAVNGEPAGAVSGLRTRVAAIAHAGTPHPTA